MTYRTMWWGPVSESYLCEIESQPGLRSKVYVTADGEIAQTMLREDRPEDAAMLAQVRAEAPAAIAGLPRISTSQDRRDRTKRPEHRRPVQARQPGVCVRTGELYQAGTTVVWTTGGWAIADDMETALNSPPASWEELPPF
jgi:hypothetical protein